MKTFAEHLKTGLVRRVSKDKERALSLIAESERKLRALQETQEKVGVKDDNANDFIEACYDSLMALIRAKLYQEGYTSSGKGAHEAEVSYLAKLGFSTEDIQIMDKLRYYRNGICYYGSKFDKEYAEMVIAFAQKTHPRLLKIVQMENV